MRARARHRRRRGAGGDRGQLPGPEGVPRPVRGRPAGRPHGASPVRFVVVGQGPLDDELRRTPRVDGPRLSAADPGLSPRRPPHHRGRRPVRAGLAPRGTAGGGDGGLRRRRAGGGHRRGRTGRGGRRRRVRARWCRPRRPDRLADAIAELADDPDRAGPARSRRGRGRRAASRPPAPSCEIEEVYRRALDAGGAQVGHAGGHADDGDARRARRPPPPRRHRPRPSRPPCDQG